MRKRIGKGFYTSSQASRLAGIHPSTLAYWVSHGIVTPTRTVLDPEGNLVAEGFSFSDVAYLRVLRHLRSKGVPLEEAVVAMRHLMERFGPPSQQWRFARVYVDGKRVYAERPDKWGVTKVTKGGGGQRLEETFFGDLFRHLRESADSVLVPPEFVNEVEINPDVAGGMPVVRATRIPTSEVRKLAERLSSKAIISDYYPFLSSKQIRKAVEYEQYLDRSLKRAA